VVTVIIPTYNRSANVKRAIESVRNQEFADWELIVVDDGSNDDTGAMVASLCDSRIRYVLTGHAGVSAARNRGIALARYDWICFLDSDDYWMPPKLRRQMRELKEDARYSVIYTNEIWIRRGVRVNQKKIHRKYSGWIYERCLPLCIISPSSVLLHRDVLAAEGVFDENLPVCEDYELWLRIAARYPVRFLDEPLIVKTGGHPDQLSHQFWGMDRFRVQALIKTHQSGLLTPQQQQWTAAEIVRKAGVLATGYGNRGKAEEADEYKELAWEWGVKVRGGSFLDPATQ
jgi:glycosyltransferase involved in cell wall biosynthesis